MASSKTNNAASTWKALFAIAMALAPATVVDAAPSTKDDTLDSSIFHRILRLHKIVKSSGRALQATRGEDDVSSETCSVESAACWGDPACASCMDGAILDGSCDGTDISDCTGVAGYFCCVAGASCSDNALLLDYLNCGIGETCTLTDLCDYAAATVDDDDTSASDSDDVSSVACLTELVACQEDETCAGCYDRATMDESCERDVSNCADAAGYYCCVAGDDCSDNALAVGYIECLVETELDKTCGFSDVCSHDSPESEDDDDDADDSSNLATEAAFVSPPGTRVTEDDDSTTGTFGEFYTWSPTSSPVVSPSESDQDGNGDKDGSGSSSEGDHCAVELEDCVADITPGGCLECLMEQGNNVCNDAFDSDLTCSDLIDFYCCTFGDTCSANSAIVAYIDCWVEGLGCNVDDDLCNPEDENGRFEYLLSGTIDDDVDDINDEDDHNNADDDERGKEGVCQSEWLVCENDEGCQNCVRDATVDATCDPTSYDCVGMANMYCCITGDACSENAPLVNYINCEMEAFLDEACAFTDLCEYSQDPGGAIDDGNREQPTETPFVDPAGDDDDLFGVEKVISEFFSWSPTSSPTSAPTEADSEITGGRGGRGGGGRGGGRGGRGDGSGGRGGRGGKGGKDGGGGRGDRGGRGHGDGEKSGKNDLCLPQQTACQEDATCAPCVEESNTDGTCFITGDSCPDMAGYYCCLAGGISGCSDSELLLDFINCEIGLESCTLTDLCGYTSDSNSDDKDGV